MGASVVVKSPGVRKQNALLLVDCVVIASVVMLGHLAALHFNFTKFRHCLAAEIPELLLLTFTLVLTLYVFDMYNVRSFLFMTGRLVRITFAVLSAMGFAAVFMYLGRFKAHLTVYALLPLLLIPILYYWREFFFSTLVKRKKRMRVLLVGDDPINEMIDREVFLDPISEHQVVKMVGKVREAGPPGRASLGGIVRAHSIDMVVFSLGVTEEYSSDLLALKAGGVEIFDSLTFYKLITGRVPISNLKDSVISCLSGRLPMPSYYRNAKRLIDIVLSLFGLIVSFPVVALAALLVWLESPGPILFKPERMGENGRPIRLLKLRTMYCRSEGEEGSLFTQANDSRVTKVGAFLRRTGLDEFPQLLNVLRGDMSLVGPRPIEEVFVEKYIRTTPLYYMRSSMKPGISGWAQVMQVGYPNTDRAQMEKLQYDLFYITHASLFLDGVIILKTLKKFLNFGSHDRRPAAAKHPSLEQVDERVKEFVLN